MGNKKKQNTFQQMKFYALVALLATVSAVKVQHHTLVQLAAKAKTHHKHAHMTRSLIKIRNKNRVKQECPELTAEEDEEIADAINGMPDDLEITGQDYLDFMEAEGIELTEDEMVEAEALFDMIDQDGNGAHSKGELQDAMALYEEHC